MKKWKLLSMLLVICMVFSLAACGDSAAPAASSAPAAGSGEESSSEPIVIGVISPNTGALAAYGNGIVTGVDLAVEEINAAGGILGRPVEVIKTDDQSDHRMPERF